MMRFVFSLFVSLLIGNSMVQCLSNEPKICVCPAKHECNNVYGNFSEALEQSQGWSRSMIFVLFSYYHDTQLAQCLLSPEEFGSFGWADFASFVILQPNCACETEVPAHLRSFLDVVQDLPCDMLDENQKFLLEQVTSADQSKPCGVFVFTIGLDENQNMALLKVERD